MGQGIEREAAGSGADPLTYYDRGFQYGADPESHVHADGCGHSGEGVEPEFMRGWRAGREHRKTRVAGSAGADPEPRLDAIEAKIAEIRGPLTIMLALKMVEDGHAPNAGSARRMIEADLDAVLALYGEAADA